jgi:uncharacterized protein YecT (DUF1311 family)
MRLPAVIFCTTFSAAVVAVPGAYGFERQDQTQLGLNACADAAYQKADSALNSAYKEIVGRLKGDAGAAKLLIAAQRAWIGYRDADCAFSSAANAGGSIYPMVYSICLEAVTKERTKELAVFLKCGDGDMGCPAPAR